MKFRIISSLIVFIALIIAYALFSNNDNSDPSTDNSEIVNS